MHPKVDDFLNEDNKWHKELTALRNLILDCGLTEEWKWRVPCYTHQGKNIVLIHGFKEYCAIAFFKGVLLKDELGILIQQTENVQSGRQIRFSSIQEMRDLESQIKKYIFEAIEVEKMGLKVALKKTEQFDFPSELESILKGDAALKKAFDKLTPGRKRGYLLHFSQAKQSSTKVSRIEKNIPRILKGKGLNDCICGHSKRLPNCDGSHKYIQ